MSDKVTAPKLKAFKTSGRKIVCVTAYDVVGARIAEEAGVDLVLVGDSVGNVVLGYANTIPVTLEEMAHHTRAVARGLSKPLLVSDMPFGSYQVSVEDGVRAALVLVKNGAEAVKLEGDYPEATAAITRSGIPVIAHLGMTPQSVHKFGGFKVQGRGEAADELVAVAGRLAGAGAVAIVLELVPADLAARVTATLDIPTIGIGAGLECDGQIQVFHDLLGYGPELRHAKRYANLATASTEALRAYAEEVRTSRFPDKEHSF